MKKARTIQDEIRRVRILINSNNLTERGEDQAYGVECGLRWALGELDRRESTSIPQAFSKKAGKLIKKK